MKKYDALSKGLKREIAKRKISFHMPGHKGRIDMMNEDFFEMDYTFESSQKAYKNNAETYLTMSQNQAATIYRSQRVFYLAGGEDSGIYAMLTLCLKEGEKIIVDRNCKKAVIDAIILIGAIPVFITGVYMPRYDFLAPVDADDVEYAISQHSDAKAVLLTSPTPYGCVADIKSIASVVHKNEMYLLVDESEGGHFSFSQRLPASSTRLGADFTVQSLSKSLGSLLGTGVLHVNTNDFVSSKIIETIDMYQMSNPSFALYSISEKAVSKAFSSARKFKTLTDTINKCATFVNECTKAYWVDGDIKETVFDFDITKIVVNFAYTTLSGYDVARKLNDEYGIEVETCDDFNIVCTATIYNKTSEIKRLANAIVAIVEGSAKKVGETEFVTRNPIHNLKIIPRDAYFGEGELINIDESIGRISKNVISKNNHPAILVPGEEITELHVKVIMEAKDDFIFGLREGNLIEVVKKS
ncbi:MAG: aminotransferase class I/II-fold pyridoxal phosphate-dependent enzyme [Ruminococcaceae bacterium]|nr:aminotransferase class I/II-fold pyridoxal phosphate-dependent enzyme [Oscillospiraceae bacterium]